ncbi:MAG: selenium cofactor biosynthesis protein YqeC [Shewanella sp.]
MMLLDAIYDQDHASTQLLALVGGGGKSTTAFVLARQAKARGLKVLITTTTKMYLPRPYQFDTIIDADYLSYQIDSHDSSVSLSAPRAFISTTASPDCGDTTELYPLKPRHYTPSSSSTASIYFCYQKIIEDIENKERNKVTGLSTTMLDKLKSVALFDLIIIEADGAKHLPIKAPSGHEPCIPSSVDTVIAVTGCEIINQKIDPRLIHRWTDFQHITQCKAGEILDQQVLSRLIAHKNGMFKHAPKKAKRVWIINKVELSDNYPAVRTLAMGLLKQEMKLDVICLANMQAFMPIKEVMTKRSITKSDEDG